MAKALANIKNVFFISEIIGAFEVLAIVVYRDSADFKKIVNRIRADFRKKVEVALADESPYPVREEYTNILFTQAIEFSDFIALKITLSDVLGFSRFQKLR